MYQKQNRVMFNVNMSSFAKPVVQQRRFKYLFVSLISLALILGLVVVVVEKGASGARINSWFDGIWWGAITVTGAGTGDAYPVTMPGRLIGIVLAGVGVLSYSLLISMFSMALSETKDKYYRKKLFEQLELIEHKLDRLEKHNEFVMKSDHE